MNMAQKAPEPKVTEGNALLEKYAGKQVSVMVPGLRSEIDFANRALMNWVTQRTQVSPDEAQLLMQRAKKGFQDIADCFSSIPKIQNLRSYELVNPSLNRIAAGDGKPVILHAFIYQYASSMVGFFEAVEKDPTLADKMTPELSASMLDLWDTGTKLEDIANVQEKGDIGKIKEAVNSSAKNADPTLKDPEGNYDKLDGEALNAFKGIDFTSEKYGREGIKDSDGAYHANPYYVAERRYLLILLQNEPNKAKTSGNRTPTKSEDLSGVVPKLN